jgi:hypothetical protein
MPFLLPGWSIVVAYTANHESDKKLLPVSKASLCRVDPATERLALVAWRSQLSGQDKSGFPDGYDAVQVAPTSHRVLFENAFVSAGGDRATRNEGANAPSSLAEPLSVLGHGGRTAHTRYYPAGGGVRDHPSRETPVSEGKWRVTWMEPEPMHSIENVETAESALTLPKRPPTVRVEFKVHP